MEFKYSFLCLIRSKSYLFFALAFPILLSTFFNAVFGGDLLADFNPIPVAIVEESSFAQPLFVDTLHALADLDEPIIEIIPAGSIEEATTMLASGDIAGLFILSGDIELVVANTGLNQSILQNISNEFLRRSATIGDIAAERPDLVFEIVAQINAGLDINQDAPGLQADLFVYYFYALLAMVSFMGAQVGFQVSISVQASVSPLAARRSISPTRKITVIANGFLAALLVHFLVTIVSVAYLIFVLGINFGQNLPLVLLVCLVGSLAGVSFGILIATVMKGKPNVREAAVTAISFVFWAASGLFQTEIRRAVRNAAPILDRLNPTTLMSDAFASLVIYDHLNHYFQSLLILLAMSACFLLISAVVLRRTRYAES